MVLVVSSGVEISKAIVGVSSGHVGGKLLWPLKGFSLASCLSFCMAVTKAATVVLFATPYGKDAQSVCCLFTAAQHRACIGKHQLLCGLL